MKPLATATLAFAALVLVPRATAHFRLLEPASWIEESNLGDPQKAGPCGTSEATAGKPTNQVTRVQGGQKIKIKIQETVFHPGFYRVALSVNSRNELPADPKAETKPSDRGAWSVSGQISYPPMPPILADGLFQHTSRVTGEMETEVEIPNITCAKCTLQVIQFMADHGLNKEGDYTYHHCADIAIRADPYKSIDSRFPAEKKLPNPTVGQESSSNNSRQSEAAISDAKDAQNSSIGQAIGAGLAGVLSARSGQPFPSPSDRQGAPGSALPQIHNDCVARDTKVIGIVTYLTLQNKCSQDINVYWCYNNGRTGWACAPDIIEVGGYSNKSTAALGAVCDSRTSTGNCTQLVQSWGVVFNATFSREGNAPKPNVDNSRQVLLH